MCADAAIVSISMDIRVIGCMMRMWRLGTRASRWGASMKVGTRTLLVHNYLNAAFVDSNRRIDFCLSVGKGGSYDMISRL